GNGKWEMGNGKWEMGNGKWEMGNGKWEMGNGKWEIYYEKMAELILTSSELLKVLDLVQIVQNI
ncbi:MAG: hypothetical protein WBF77_02110, partial [Sulfurimonadaceae bacterium]